MFQVQPYDITYKPFVVHVLPSPNGKANEKIIDILHYIRDEVKKRNVNIRSFAFDGDSAYKNLHKMYYESYIHKVMKTHSLSTKGKNAIHIVSDFLHLIKRLRYRLLSLLIHAGFDMNSILIDVQQLKEILQSEYPVIWDNSKYTKMHDKLPIELFKIENLIKLIESKNFAAAGYWFPISLSLLAIDSEELGFDYRKFFLETAFWFLVFYREAWNRTEGRLKQRSYQDDRHVIFYTEDLLIEFTNTIHSHLRLMNSLNRFSFDRNSSMPLEHKFGIARTKAHDVHTLKRFLRTIATLQIKEQERLLANTRAIEEQCDEVIIKKRRSTFGVTVELKSASQDKYCVFYDEAEHMFTPQQVATSMLIMCGFDFKQNEEIIDTNEVFSWTCFLLTEFCDGKQEERRRRNRLSLLRQKLGTGQCKQAQARITGKVPEEKRFTSKASKYDTAKDLLCQLCGGNPTKKDLCAIITEIKKYDADVKTPSLTDKKKYLCEWICDNIPVYYGFLCQFLK